jgi:DivIVA domain-containing protein
MPEFPVVFRGYNRYEVDGFISRIEGTLGRCPLFAPPVSADEVGTVRFGTALRGYLATAVDEVLDGYRHDLEVREGGGRRRLPSAGADRLIGLARNVRFASTWRRSGYDEGDVDAFLDQMIVALGTRRAWAGDVRAARFGTTRLRRGYSQPEVDAFLEHLANEIERIRRGRAS